MRIHCPGKSTKASLISSCSSETKTGKIASKDPEGNTEPASISIPSKIIRHLSPNVYINLIFITPLQNSDNKRNLVQPGLSKPTEATDKCNTMQ